MHHACFQVPSYTMYTLIYLTTPTVTNLKFRCHEFLLNRLPKPLAAAAAVVAITTTAGAGAATTGAAVIGAVTTGAAAAEGAMGAVAVGVIGEATAGVCQTTVGADTII